MSSLAKTMNKHPTQIITVGARESKLSKCQVKEVEQELQKFHPSIAFHPFYIETLGDIDQTTSLRDLGKSDFFTRELDAAQSSGWFRVSIHSAKDLPEPLHPELEVIALTEGVDRSDSLVLPEGETLESLPQGAVIATSSERREDMVRELRSDLTFTDIRGTIEKRLEQLDFGRVDGVVIAEAALIRLGLTHHNRVTLPGDTVEGQGQLAIIARKGDEEMKHLFSCIDVRQTI